jgi:hypothetical protein
MKISHGALEECVRDPNRWLTAQQSGQQRFYSLGYDQILLFGIYRFHRTRSEQVGAAWIDALFQRHAERLTTEFRREGVREQYRSYAEWCLNTAVPAIEPRVVLNGDFRQFLTLGGLLHRVDATPTGVRGVILGDYRATWRSELRMPLIQIALAARYGLDRAAVVVGVQRLDGSDLRETTFDRRRLAQAQREFRTISEYVRQRWTPS